MHIIIIHIHINYYYTLNDTIVVTECNLKAKFTYIQY